MSECASSLPRLWPSQTIRPFLSPTCPSIADIHGTRRLTLSVSLVAINVIEEWAVGEHLLFCFEGLLTTVAVAAYWA